MLTSDVAAIYCRHLWTHAIHSGIGVFFSLGFHVIGCVIFMRSCCVFDFLRLLHFPLFAVYLLSFRPVFPPGHQLLLPRCGGQIPCALPLMRTLSSLSSTTLSHFLKDHVYRESQLKIDWTEETCKEMGELAQQDHTYRFSRTEVSHIEQVGQDCADASSTRFSSCNLTQQLSPSRLR